MTHLRRFKVSVLGLAFIAVTSGAAGQPAEAPGERYSPPTHLKQPASLPDHIPDRDVWRLRLNQVIELAMRQNLELEIQRLSVQAREHVLRARRGSFEPQLTGRYEHRDFDDSPNENWWNVAIGQRFRTGTELSLEFRNNWPARSTDITDPRLFRSELELNVTQPLLRGFSLDTDIPSSDVLRAEFDSEGALAEARVAAADTIRASELAYWDLVQVLKSYEVRIASRDLAERQFELTVRQIEAGLLPPSDRIAAQGTIARRDLDLVRAEQSIEDASDRLRRVLNVAERNWTRPIVPMDAPIFKEESLDLRALVIKGQSRRPEVLRAKLGVDRAAFEKRVANNNRLPRLDVGVGYGVAGGDETFGRSLSRLSELNDRYWTAFVSLSWAPLGLETGAEQDRAKVEAERARVEKRQLLEDIRLQVREAVRAVRTAARQVRAAARSRALAEQSLEVEERKFLNGMSSNFVMAQRQEELAQARLAELNAVVEHSKARVNLDYATGVLLERHHVELALRTAR